MPQPLPVGGWGFAEFQQLDDVMLSVLAEHNVPGGALAVVRGNQLMAVRSYGWADIDERRPLTPDSRFRIASLSKSMTAVAILQMIEHGQLAMETKVFDLLELTKLAPDQEPADPRWHEITIDQLLRHRGGFDRAASLDPMFQSVQIAKDLQRIAPAGFDDIIQWMLARPLDFAPGERYAYSNFGYLLLGRAIEKISGTAYEDYLKQRVLKPLGARQTTLGRTLREHRQPGEVTYYAPGELGQLVMTGRRVSDPFDAPKVPAPYGAWCVETMDAHGGWIASVVDLARYLVLFTDPANSRVLRPQTVARIANRPRSESGTASMDAEGEQASGNQQAVEEYYGLGWMIRPGSNGAPTQWWHTGSLPGTAALMVRRENGLAWVVLLNRRSGPDGKHLGYVLEPRLAKAIDAIEHWPDYDAFELVTPQQQRGQEKPE